MDGETPQPERGQSWDGCVRRSIDVELRVINEEERTIEVIASSETLDSHGDILRQFWDLDRYTKNPVVLWNHNRFGVHQYTYEGAVRPEDLFPIGQSLDVKVKSKKLHATIKLGSAEYSEIAQKVFLGCKEGIIRAVSVGFRPGSITAVKDKAGNTKYYELGSAEFPNELREISFVPMGSNPDAVAKSVESDRANLGRLMAERSGTAAPSPQETETMTAEEQKALETARAEATSAKAEATTATKRAETAETTVAALQSELKAAREQLAKQAAEQGKALLDGMEGKKFAKPSREHFEKVLASQGIDATKALLESLPDLAVTQPVLVDGKAVSATPPTPAPTEDEGTDTGSIISKAMKGTQATA